MVLRNAFEAMATESTSRDQYDALIQVLEELRSRRPPSVDSADRTRVVTDTASTMLAYLYTSYFGNAGAYSTWYAQGLLGSLDPREEMAQIALVNYNQVRQQRWVL